MSGGSIWLSYNREELDAQYNNQRTVPDYDNIMREWTHASDLARKEIDFRADLPYSSHPRARIDFYPAAGGGPAVLFFHGGFWRSFDKRGIAFLVPAFLKAGITVALANYPLAPEARMVTIVSYALEAVRWVVAHSEGLDIEPSKLWIAGHSAGAHLALTSVLAAGEDGLSFAGCCAISGIYELEPIRLSYLNDSLNLTLNDVAQFSPVRLGVGSTPLIAAVGASETEEFRRQTAALVDHWRAAGGRCSTMTLPKTDHYEAVRGLARPGSALFAQLASAVLGPS
jgi:arylformamidase